MVSTVEWLLTFAHPRDVARVKTSGTARLRDQRRPPPTFGPPATPSMSPPFSSDPPTLAADRVSLRRGRLPLAAGLPSGSPVVDPVEAALGDKAAGDEGHVLRARNQLSLSLP